MLTLFNKSTITPNLADCATTHGTVAVTFTTEASPENIWQALTDPSSIAKWFGTITTPFSPDQEICLAFGDGDFFILNNVESSPLKFLRYNWRFLGIGPFNTITWCIETKDERSQVTVIDEESERSPAAAAILREGWLDFTQRLERFLATGASMRYDWRREIDGNVELPCNVETAWNVLFSTSLLVQWFPLNGTDWQTSDHFTLTDEVEQIQFQILNLVLNVPSKVQFQVIHPDWLEPTVCQLELVPYGDRSLLTFQHRNWEAISFDSHEQLKQRQRFCLFWIQVLQRSASLFNKSEHGQGS